MKASEIHIGEIYTAKVGGKQQEVRIQRKLPKGGWEAISLASNKKIRIKGAQQVIASVVAEAPVEQEASAAIVIEPQQSTEAQGVIESEGTVAGTTEAAAPTRKKGPRRSKRVAGAEPAGPKKLSCLDAAAAVLKSSGEPMQCKAMIHAMFAAQLWHSDAPTPAATLYSAILREITTKGANSRFKKTERGHFALNA